MGSGAPHARRSGGTGTHSPRPAVANRPRLLNGASLCLTWSSLMPKRWAASRVETSGTPRDSSQSAIPVAETVPGAVCSISLFILHIVTKVITICNMNLSYGCRLTSFRDALSITRSPNLASKRIIFADFGGFLSPISDLRFPFSSPSKRWGDYKVITNRVFWSNLAWGIISGGLQITVCLAIPTQ